MRKHEQKFCTELQKWLRYNMRETCFIEAKVSLGNKPLNFKGGFRPHQIPTLRQIQNGPFSFKPSDIPQLQQPYDIAFSYQAKAFIAVMWIRPKNKTFYLIDPAAIDKLMRDGVKSLSEEVAKSLAVITGEYK